VLKEISAEISNRVKNSVDEAERNTQDHRHLFSSATFSKRSRNERAYVLISGTQ